jgi:transposase
MLIIGCDYHPSFQQIAWLNTESGECGNRRLEHNDEAEAFYRGLRGQTVVVGMEATGGTGWFRQLLSECGHGLQVADAAQVRARATRRQKTDARDAELLRELLLDPKFVWLSLPTAEQRDRRQLLLHRHRLVQMRTRVKNQLQSLAMDQGVRQQKKLWSSKGRTQLQALSLPPWTAVRRGDLLQLLDDLDQRLVGLDREVRQQAFGSAEVRRLMTHPGVGPVVGLAFQLTILDPQRFASSRKLTSYLGFNPSEHSSGGKQRLGHISKQGNALLRGWLVEAAQVAVRRDAQWGRQFRRLAMRKNRSIAIVATARKLAVRLWWMWKRGLDYGQMIQSGSHVE